MDLLWVTARRFGEDLPQRTQIEVARALTARGWKVTFAAPKSDIAGQVVADAGASLIEIERSRTGGMGWLTFGRSLKRTLPDILAAGDFDVALVGWQGIAGSHKALRASNTPWLLVDRGPPVFSSILGRLQRWEYRRAWRLAESAAGYVVKSQALADWAHENTSCSKPMTLMPAGVDLERFQLGQNSDSPVIIYHGRLDAERNVSLIVDIGDELVAQGHEVAMHLIGAGNAWDSLARCAHERSWLTLSTAVTPEEIPGILSVADVGLFPLPDSPQWRVASALKIREWAACGLPVVASDIESHRTLGERGWLRLLPASSPPDVWGEMILAVLAERAELGRKARRDAEAEFSWEMATEALHERLLELTGA